MILFSLQNNLSLHAVLLYAAVTGVVCRLYCCSIIEKIINQPNNKMKMKQKVCIASILLLGTVCAKANNYKVSSPDGRLAVKVECVDGKAFYSVELNGK